MPVDPRVSESWDAEYRAGRYRGEPPLPFVGDILLATLKDGVTRGLYVGCGNGRNFVPLSQAGLILTGLDVSTVAVEQLAQRWPSYRERLRVGDLSSLPARLLFPLVIGIQVFQHGSRATCHANLRLAQAHLDRGGLFCLRVNAVGSEYEHESEEVEKETDGSRTVRYLSGPKRDLLIHFFSEPELQTLFGGRFQTVLPIRRVVMSRNPPGSGHWDQWEAIWRKT
jgi:hypothetical protein